ncbi:two-partner secretion domain-containing protein [Calothrix sp. NIES-2100]|uniref:two-partner secretion domain-containing protein n=1 Tax=Calothrix sp. NIES-2100 TaxID=1954172 RepID=UPI0030D956BA
MRFTHIFPWFLVSSFTCLSLTTFNSATAQITPDNTLGTEGAVVTPDTIKGIPSQRIDGGAIRGSNLFHSFSEFNIGSERGAYFTNPSGIENILTRVTGTNVSRILGTLGVLGNANLFLMNPNGIVFGANARLDVNGSFVGSTANSFVFGNGLEFSATNPQAPPLLKINVPIGLQTTSNQGDISNAGKLAVNAGKDLTLFGSTVTSTGSLIAPGGTVQLLGERVGLLNNAQIDVSANKGGGTVLIGGDFQGSGTTPTAKRTYIGPRVNINANALSTGNGGNVIIASDEVTGFYGNITARGGSVSGNGGLVQVSGKQNLIFRGSVDNSAIKGLFGRLLLDTKNIIIANGSGNGTDSFALNNSGISGSILSAPLSQINKAAPTTIYESKLEGLSGNTNLILQATNNITINPLSDRTLNLTNGSGKITFTADADRDGIGNFKMATADTIKTNGRNITISGASLTLGNIDTEFMKGGDIIAVVDVDAGGTINNNDLKNELENEPENELDNEEEVDIELFKSTTFTFKFKVSESQPIGDLDVQFSASHSWDNDLVVDLISPSGRNLELFSRVGSNGDNFQDTLLDDSAATSINNASPPFRGRFKPTGKGGLASFNGENPRGIWKLEVTDVYPEKDSGVLYKAGETAPWGTANGTKLIFRNPILSDDSGSINLNATNGNINVGKINAVSLIGKGGEVNLTATENIKFNGSLAAANNIKILADVDANRIGNVRMNTADIIRTNGRKAEITGVNLTLGNIDTSVDTSDKLSGGNITLTATGGDISTQNLYSFSSSSSDSGNAGSGGAIALTTTQGNISTKNINSSSSSDSGNAGSGGAIALTTTQGKISTLDINSYSNSRSGDAGSGGAIALTTTRGKISTLDINSYSAGETAVGSGGAIALTTTQGNISTHDLVSESNSDLGTAGSGGAITLTTTQGNISTEYLDSRSVSSSSGGNGGAIALTTTHGDISTQSIHSDSNSDSENGGSGGAITLTTTYGDISTLDLRSNSDSSDGNAGSGGAIALTTTQGNISTEYLDSSSQSAFGNAGSGGAIALTTTKGNISTHGLDSASISDSGNAGSGGAIALTTTQGNISTQDLDSYSYSRSGNAESGGAIALTTTQGNILTQGLDSYSFSLSENAGNGGIITLSAIDGNIDVNLDIDWNIISATLNSFSVSPTGNSGAGGNVTLAAKNNITDLDILTLSSASKSGDVQINGFGDLSLTNTNIITSKQLTIKNPLAAPDENENITLDVSGVGQSGNVDITSTGNLTFKDSRIESDTRGSDPAGNVKITSPGTVTFNNSKIASNTSSTGNAGNIQIDANNLTLTDTSEISASTTAEGFAGDITIDTPTLTVANGAQIFATTTGKGDGGTITVNAPNLVNLGIGVQDFAPIISVETTGAGKAGNIIVNTPSLTVSDTARITATATATATNTEDGGSITLNASKLDLAGIVGIFAETQGQAPAGTLQLNPYQNQPDLDITLFPNSTISASTSASGKGGDLILTAPENINIAGSGKLAVESTGTGEAGNIQITTQNLNINDGVKISASTINSGQGGNININSHTLTANNGSQFLTTTSGTKKAGNINVKVRDRITLDGTNTGIFANTETGSTGVGGSITIDPEIFLIKNGAGIGVNSQGSGQGGNISLQAGTLTLDNQAFINAATVSSQGGEITLEVKDFLFLRHNSNITATAGTDKAGGNGGNITINSPFIIAVDQEDSNITANAYSGTGGNINIFTQGIFGIGFQAQETQQSGITASSELGVSGNVTISTPEVDPRNGLVQLPSTLVDASGQIDNSCKPGSKQQANSFIITGRGGLPYSPIEPLQDTSTLAQWVKLSNRSQNSLTEKIEPIATLVTTTSAISSASNAIVEASGLVVDANGDILLVAEVPKVTPHIPAFTSVACSASN